MKKFKAFMNKVCGIAAAIIGVVQILVSVLKESLVTLTRVCALLFFWTDVDEKVIAWLTKVVGKFDLFSDALKGLCLVLFKDSVLVNEALEKLLLVFYKESK